MAALYWFRNDLRLDDNPGLVACAADSRLLCVYFWPRSLPWCNVTGMGVQRRRFLLESLACLQRQLREKGQDLLISTGSPEKLIPQLVLRHRLARVGTAQVPGTYESMEIERVRGALAVPLVLYRGNTLFDAPTLPPSLTELPAHPPPIGLRHRGIDTEVMRPDPSFIARGGSQAAQRRLREWMFREKAVLSYRGTRDELQGLYSSSALSPWLANGSLSVRRLASALADFESRHGANESTDWLYRELLWREFFQYRAYADGAALFRPPVAGRCRTCTFEPRSFARWCAGDTDFPLVNALMRQLVSSGWMSNRGRQIAASCLVNELALDWRFGAAFFEKYLIDYDVSSNYGNWAYIAGVGADPRRGRHFDIDRQAARFDPNGDFTRRWGGFRPAQPKYVVDAADWPILEPDNAPG
jgi:deoxyribodipyrimidine photo-lyase